jgi:hypothetical protein
MNAPKKLNSKTYLFYVIALSTKSQLILPLLPRKKNYATMTSIQNK